MNFDDLKSAWDSDKTANVDTPVHLTRLKTAQTPIDQLRKQMKQEFFLHCLALIITGFVPQLLNFNPVFILPFYALYTLYVAICAYYMIKMYLFYKRLSTNALSSRDNLYETYYDIRIHVEMYKSYTYAISPFAILIGLILILNAKDGALLNSIQEKGLAEKDIFLVGGALLAAIVAIIITTEIWISRYYSKYAKQIRQLLDLLKDETAA
ncbi:hypothetical protein [Chitinophaga defluvii]|uniref:Uncharacterized protein n=1 Tax=Chitinophaga defluvii TaxID=3163343 RepID=A0ABV2T3A4_9BACT